MDRTDAHEHLQQPHAILVFWWRIYKVDRQWTYIPSVIGVPSATYPVSSLQSSAEKYSEHAA